MADVAITSEWGTPAMIEDGVVPELLLGRKYGHRLHFWDMRTRKLTQTVDLGDEHQMVLELRPAHDPTKKCGFVGVVVSVEDLSASIWMWPGGGLTFDEGFFPEGEAFRGRRTHQVRLQGGDASSDSYCFPSEP